MSSQLLRLLFGYWLGATLLLTLLLSLIDVLERHREVIRAGEQASEVVASSMAVVMPPALRQSLVEAYGKTSGSRGADDLNLLLVLDGEGRVAYSSRPAWRTLPIGDPVFSFPETSDPEFRAVVDCFRLNRDDCGLLRSSNIRLATDSLTVIRSVEMASQDLGLPRQRFLVVVNFDAGLIWVHLLEDVLVWLLVSMLFATLLAGFCWLTIAMRLLPRMAEEAQTDGLTGLSNRNHFMEQAITLLAAAEESHGSYVFAILDIDHFKRINDTYGHGCGDAALVAVAGVLKAVTRPEDLVCRFGGEEFALLIPAPKEAGRRAMERLRIQLETSSVLYGGHRLSITASIGALATADSGYNIDYLYTVADRALYQAKQEGRNRVVWFGGESISLLRLSP
ncbi:GGDEF domain-containing protein [Cyanobium sp. Cruz CV13-4-11]|uniref:GGDEF domain-containing protein n=1 Tax=unclassified Cyanobium TaxID=2627006 RepID=UPI0020CC2DBA|nr:MULTISPECIES: GGDEF domain-containing protein [unclassified Cyanobium]MCP9899875.1 GGDEF domain-containing protein [Cyanobium sp. Cruz CV11-17]MCP9918906.1 GGDEF domain-containing protein [Cyanobium sp. Cruz CV13-4-11]